MAKLDAGAPVANIKRDLRRGVTNYDHQTTTIVRPCRATDSEGASVFNLYSRTTTPSASITYTTVTLTTAFDTVVLYNSTQSGRTISVHTFGAQTITAGTFTLTMPSNTTTTALLRLATV